MATLAEEYLETDVGKVQLFRGGEGDPVVYLHSAAGEMAAPPLALEDLADNHTVVAPVFPGFGESEGIENIDDMEDAVFHLLDVFDRLGLQAPVVSGLSLGGWMAAELATRYPERVSRLVLMNPVGLYIDGVFYARPAVATLDFLDVERVEVLRGPQGTLFGKNTTAGAINVTTRKPSFTRGADFELNVGDLGFVQAKASVTGPLGRRVAGRLSFSGTQRRGTVYNVKTQDYVNDLDNTGVRGQLPHLRHDALAVALPDRADRDPGIDRPRLELEARGDEAERADGGPLRQTVVR